MKYTKILFWFVVCLFFVGVTVHSASALNLSNGVVAYYTFDTLNSSNPGGNPTMIEWWKSYNVTSSVNTPTWNLSGKHNQAWDYEHSNSEYSIINTNTNYGTNVNTVCAWIDLDTGCPDTNRCNIWGGDDNRTFWGVSVDDSEKPEFWYRSTGVDGLCTGATAISQVGFQFLCMVFNASAANEMQIYINGGQNKTCNMAGALDDKENKNYFGAGHVTTQWFDGKIDEVAMWERPLNNQEINHLWNGGAGNFTWYKGGIPPGPDDLNLSANPYPTLAQFNINPATVWATANATSNWTCRLYLNGTLNQTKQYLTGINVNCSFQINLTNGGWTYFIRGNTSIEDENTTNGNLYFDNINPVITLNTFNTGLLYYNSNLSWNFTITDSLYLHRINVTINNGVGQIFGLMDVNTTSYPLNLTYNTTGLNVGDYVLSVTACDGHTTQSIQDYGITTLTSGLQYTTKSIILQLKSKDSLDYFSTTKLKDRYTFEYEPFKTLNSYTLDVISSEKIHFAEKDGFKWLISGNNWIDFAPYQVRYNRINDKHVQAIIENPSLDTKLKFNSIGDLNCITKNYSFAITNLTVIYNNPVVETSVETFRLRIDNQNSLVTNTTAQLYWNGTLIATTKSVTATFDRFTGVVTMPTLTVDQTFQFNWVYNITTLNGSLSGNLSFNQTVLNINVNNTWGCTPIVLYFDYQDEITNASLLVNTESLLTLEFNNIDYVFNFSQNNVSNTTFCINPALASVGVNATVWHVWEDDSQDYYSREYRNRVLLQNTTSQVNLTNLTLLLLSKTYNQTVRHNIYVADSNDLPQRGFYVHMYKFSIAKNNYTFIESFKSNIDGLGVISGVDERYYRFQVFNPVWDLVYESETFKLITIDVYLRITETMTILQDWMRLKNSLNYTLYWNNNTHVATFTWNDPTNLADQLCLRVTQMMVGNTTVLYDACSNALTGTLTYNVSALQNRTFVAYAYENGSLYLLDTKSLSYFLNPMDWGTDGLLIGVLWLGTIGMIAIGVTPVTALALMEVGFLSLFVLGFVHIGYTSFISMALGVVIIILLKVRN